MADPNDLRQPSAYIDAPSITTDNTGGKGMNKSTNPYAVSFREDMGQAFGQGFHSRDAEVEALKAENERLTKTLRDFMEASEEMLSGGTYSASQSLKTVLQRAIAALGEKGKG